VTKFDPRKLCLAKPAAGNLLLRRYVLCPKFHKPRNDSSWVHFLSWCRNWNSTPLAASCIVTLTFEIYDFDFKIVPGGKLYDEQNYREPTKKRNPNKNLGKW